MLLLLLRLLFLMWHRSYSHNACTELLLLALLPLPLLLLLLLRLLLLLLWQQSYSPSACTPYLQMLLAAATVLLP